MNTNTSMVQYWNYRDNGKENGNYYSILGLYRDNGKENGNYYNKSVGHAAWTLGSGC